MENRKKTVYVGLSGGVDSSVSAARLIKAGYSVVGVFIRTWVPDFLDCNIEAERLDAMRVAATLGIPFRTLDAEEAYKNEVADYMIREYQAGRTPNPDVMCNKFVKFGAFLDFALAEGADMVATGHYAEVKHEGESYHLHRGKDPLKDQSYFLWTLTPHELERIVFPIGDSVKSAIREEAGRYSLPTAAKNDSQGICFLGHVDMKDFLMHYIESKEGNVLDEAGNSIGTHDGAIFYTIGQRNGFSVKTVGDSSSPHYVVSKDVEKNTITVSPRLTTISGKTLILSDVNQISEDFGEECEAQFRYRQKPFKVGISRTEEGHVMLTVLENSIETPSAGQSCVLYRGDRCLGGGIINTIL
jgi:tRNA-specific 2-thiouridylase